MTSAEVRRPVLRWHGGKWNLAPKIIEYFPPHRNYTEVFGGAASVLMRKPRCYSEVYNDLDGDVVNLFRVLQWPDTAEALKQKITMTPYSRQEFELSYKHHTDAVERARRLVIRSLMGFGSNSHNASINTGFRSNSNRSGTTPAHDWANYPRKVDAMVNRLRGVVIECRPAAEVLHQHDGPETLHYVDPPYVRSTRSQKMGRKDCYNYEMTEMEHHALAETLKSLAGMVVLSGYASKLYDVDLYAGWERVEIKALADGAHPRVEILWLNARASSEARRQRTLF